MVFARSARWWTIAGLVIVVYRRPLLDDDRAGLQALTSGHRVRQAPIPAHLMDVRQFHRGLIGKCALRALIARSASP